MQSRAECYTLVLYEVEKTTQPICCLSPSPSHHLPEGSSPHLLLLLSYRRSRSSSPLHNLTIPTRSRRLQPEERSKHDYPPSSSCSSYTSSLPPPPSALSRIATAGIRMRSQSMWDLPQKCTWGVWISICIWLLVYTQRHKAPLKVICRLVKCATPSQAPHHVSCLILLGGRRGWGEQRRGKADHNTKRNESNAGADYSVIRAS